MSRTKTLGGDRLGNGKKMKVELKAYERSTHDLGYLWRSTMAAGTLVPFLSKVGLPGDTWDIELDADIKTHPTIGPLFGSYKVQLDIFQIPIRLYQAQLHNNKTKVGLTMGKVKLPQIEMEAKVKRFDNKELEDIDNIQINPSCIFSYLNIRGIGIAADTGRDDFATREVNALPYLSYWDIYKNYYANQQEEIGAVIHAADFEDRDTITSILWTADTASGTIGHAPENPQTIPLPDSQITVGFDQDMEEGDEKRLRFVATLGNIKVSELWEEHNWVTPRILTLWTNKIRGEATITGYFMEPAFKDIQPNIVTFPLENLDTMREDILEKIKQTSAFIINKDTYAPYGLPLNYESVDGDKMYYKTLAQEGLAIKTYQSDLFNNWLSTEWIDGDEGINQITAINTEDGGFTIDTLNLKTKIYEMLNRIAVSGGTYEDWQEATYDHVAFRKAETPMYEGGLIKELVFQEVISNAEAESTSGIQPLGTLAGRGVLGGKHKGGKISLKINEMSYVMGIVSITPRIDYSQGNEWDINLKTMDDFHKPALDQIGFQDLITEQMAWWDTTLLEDNGEYEVKQKSAGKQPAWTNYMTSVNKTLGNFAIKNNEMFMTLNRRYERKETGEIEDLTTYIDPVKFNHIFADTRRDAQNFWAQIAVDATVRRKMSAKLMPNL